MSSPPSRISLDSHRPPDVALSLPVRLEELREQLSVQQAIADGARNFLAVVTAHVEPSDRDGPDEQLELRLEIQRELDGAEASIDQLEYDIAVLEQQLPDSSSPSTSRHSQLNGTAGSHGFESNWNGDLDGTHYYYPAVEKVQQLFEELRRLEDEIGQRIKIMDEIVDSFQDDTKLSATVQPTHYYTDILLRDLGEKAGKDIRSATYRLIRHGLNDGRDVCVLLLERHLHLHLIRSLARDAKHDLEKEQALRLVRRILEHATLSTPSSSITIEDHYRLQSRLIAILRGVVAIAEQADEKLRLSALETLGELVIRDVSLLVKCEGLRVVLQAMSDGGGAGGSSGVATGGGASTSSTYNEMSPILAMSFVAIVDHPELRKWLRPGIDLEIVLSGFTEVHGKGSGMEERIKATSLIVETLFKSWSGLLYLNVSGRQALTSLVDSLTNPSRVVRDTLLDMLSNIFSVHRRPIAAPVDRARDQVLPARSTDSHIKTNLIDQFTAILLLTFIDAGLIEGLAELAANPQDSSTSLRVSTLIGEILHLSNRILPARHAAVLQSLPRLFSLSTIATTTTTEGPSSGNAAGDEKLRASDTLLIIAGLNREKRHYAASKGREMVVDDDEGLFPANGASTTTGPDATSSLRNSQQRQLVESDRLRVALSIDDVSFRNLLLETGVLSTKEDSKWSVDLLIELLQGPLRNPKRLDETMRASKFMKRLLGFFHPLNWRYSDTVKDETTLKYTRLGCAMINTLLSDSQGVQYLAEDKLLSQIADCLLQLESTGQSVLNGGIDATVFSKERVETTLVGGYFDMLGEMSKSPAGLALLDQYKIFTCFYRVGELRNREDLVRAIIEKCDYSRDGHSRVFLHKALTSSYKHIRLFATKHLAALIHQSCLDLPSSLVHARSTPASLSNHIPLEWQVELVVAQLYDPSPEVAQLAISILTRICAQSEQRLDLVVRKQPQVEHLGDAAAPLLTQFLASPAGVDYLHEIDFIAQELETWYEERNYRYMVEIELSLASALQSEGGVLPPTTFDGTPPSHFYGELVKTVEGCEILDESEHFFSFCDVIRAHADEQQVLDPGYISQLKSVLWAVGHIGSTENGLAFIEDEVILPDIVEIACTSPVFSLRGTAVFALALVSSTVEGVEMLEELGWESVYRPLTGPTGLCIPMELNDLVFTPTWPSPSLPLSESISFASPTSHVDQTALVALANLSNHILATRASKHLAKLKHRHRSHFGPQSHHGPALYYRALDLLASHHYRQPVRRYILELFEFDLDDPRDVDRLIKAGRDLVKNQQDDDEFEHHAQGGGNADGSSSKVVRNGSKWSRAAVESMMLGGGGGGAGAGGTGNSNGGGVGVGGGLEGEVTEDEDQSSLDGNNKHDDDHDELGLATGKKVPLQVLTPLLTVRGFLLS